MKKHGRPIFGITRRTRLVAGVVVVAAVLVLSVIVLGYIGVFGLRSELFEVAATPDMAGDTFGGTGVNCDVIPNINLVRDASFESTTQYASMLVAGSSDSSIFLTPDAVAQAGYDTSVCAGDTARIISIDSDGVMSEKFTGIITGFKPARFGVITLIKDTKDFWSEDRIKEMTFCGNAALALTENGRLIAEVTNSQLTAIVDINEKFVKIDSNDSGFIAVSVKGSIYTSQDGKNFTLVYESGNAGGNTVCGTGSTDSTFAVCYRDGTVVTITNGKICETKIPGPDASAFASDGERFMAVDSSGNLYLSSNGMVFEKAGNNEMLKEADDLLVCASDGIFCFVEDGIKALLVRTTDSGILIEEFELSKMTGSETKSVELTNTGIIIVCTTDKKAFAVNLVTDKTTALTSENTVVESILGVSGDKVYYDSGKDVYKAQILSEFAVEGNLDGVDIIADDILITGHMQKAANGAISASEEEHVWSVTEDSAWNVYGTGSNLTVTDRSYSGSYGARLTGRSEGVHAISQTFPGKAMDNFSSGTFYRMSLYVLSDDVPDKVYCWVEGEGFGRHGFELTQIGGNYKLFSYVFAVTDQMADAGSVTLNIAIEGRGFILVDDIYLGPDSYDTAGIPDFYSDTLAAGKPSAIRLNNLNIGSTGFGQDSIYLMSSDSVSQTISGTASRADYSLDEDDVLPAFQGQAVTDSLEDSLRLVKECSSSPWFVIGPYVNQTEIDRLLEYMCGSMTSEYGGRRIDNGTALPWSRQFSRFYIEINDSGRVFRSDVQRAAYVNYVISMFTQSEYFSDIKDKTVFLDGMKYDGGTMMSDADNHTMNVKLVANDNSATYVENIDTSYVLAQYDSPHIVSGNSGEYIRSLEADGSNCAKVLSALFTQEADFAEMFLFDCAVNFVPSQYTGSGMFVGENEFVNMMTVSGLVSGLTGFEELYVDINEPLDTTVTASAEEFSSNITTACFNKDNKTYIVIANSSINQESFLINDNKLGRVDAVIRRYSAKGSLLNEKSTRNDHLRHILRPGEFIIVEITSK